ncbi:MAG: hypothetical protein OM95_09805 [Bdellovibrio sp. ArHS]|uniref:HNH endonuclease family protein n=1 Tax=Bdellovibrio sp. ArHS TaxID=1569284 RepID=UPI0005828202|nr:HNH endonuclease family protein [Bdellovibrio sp. ArHS]KHD88408.1 MAG: hypothetical protein OM95_09805 [Bdellovibrio sp. ArHS]
MKTLFLIMLLLAGGKARAQYYMVEESPQSPSQKTSLNPLDVSAELISETHDWNELADRVLSLLNFSYSSEKYADYSERYNRAKHFGSWLRDHSDGTCHNTRAKVLIRDSSVQVSFSANGCTVTAGHWADPYSNRDYQRASEIQIDHFVPLKNAYISGAYKWNWQRRCLYANYMGNEYHLLSVYGPENSSKSDKTPEGYMPPNRAYQCQYLAQWLKVKLIWSLALSVSEKKAVEELAQANHCTAAELSFSQSDLAAQRRYIANNINLCQ